MEKKRSTVSILHSTYLLNNVESIRKQLSNESSASQILKIDWTTELYISSSSHINGSGLPPRKTIRKIKDSFSVFAYVVWLYRKREKYGYFLIRHIPSSLIFTLTTVLLKDRMLVVYHAIAIAQIKTNLANTNNFFSYLKWQAKLVLENISSTILSNSNHGIIGVTEEIQRHYLGKKTGSVASFVYPNGIMADYTSKLYDSRSKHFINIIFVATYFASYHGLDKLIAAMGTYSKSVKLHIVGEVSESDKNSASLDHRIILHGTVDSSKLIDLYSIADIGLSSFSLEKLGISQACTLKVREYLAYGLPVFSGHHDVFPDSFRYYRKGSCSISEMVDFALSVRDTEKESVRDEAKPYINKTQILNSLYSKLQSTLN